MHRDGHNAVAIADNWRELSLEEGHRVPDIA
jgi:hypothetical protein